MTALTTLKGEPRHPSTFRGQRVTEANQRLLLHREPLARRLPFCADTTAGMLIGILFVFIFLSSTGIALRGTSDG